MQQANQGYYAGKDGMAMSIADANAHVVRRAFAALNAKDFEALARLFHREVAWYTPGWSTVAGEALGPDAVVVQFRKYAASTQGTFRSSLRQVLQSEDGRVVAIHQDAGERNGKRLNCGCCTVFDFEDSLILEGREHFHDLYSWDEFWS
jgi:uncharacterized protein